MTSQDSASLRVVPQSSGRDTRGPTVTICSTCWSPDLSSDSYLNETWWKCDNCQVSSCEPKVILSLQRRDFPVKSRDEVNPEMVRLCALCNSDRLEDSGCQWDHATTCQNCKKVIYDYAAGIRSVPRFRHARGEYPLKSRDDANPEMMTICALCNSDKLRDSGCQRDQSTTCDHCGKLIYYMSSGIRSVARFKYARGDYPLKRREDVNPEMISVCDLCNARDCLRSSQCGTGWITSCLHCGQTCRGKDVKKHEWLAANEAVPVIPSRGASITIVNTNAMSIGTAQGQAVVAPPRHPHAIHMLAQMGRAASMVPCPPPHTAPPPPTAPPMSPLEENGNGSEGCVICLSAAPTHAIIPCGHQCVCEACAEELCRWGARGVCPMCRGSIQATIRIFS